MVRARFLGGAASTRGRDRLGRRLRFPVRRGEAEEESKSGWFNWFGGGDDENQHPLTDVPLLLSVQQTDAGPLAIRMREDGAAANASAEDLLSLLQLVKSNIN